MAETRESTRVSKGSSWGALIHRQAVQALNAHGHHHVFELVVFWDGDECRTVGVGQIDAHHVLAHVGEHVDDVGDVKTNFDAVTTVINVEFVHGFFLLGVGRRYTQCAGIQIEAHAFEFVAGENGGALQARQQGLTAQREIVAVALGMTRL